MTFIQVLLNSQEIKRLIVQRSQEYEIPLRYVCSETGLEYRSFMDSYINASSGSPGLTERDFYAVFDLLGMSMRHQVVINKDVDMAAKSRHLREKYQREAEHNREKERNRKDR